MRVFCGCMQDCIIRFVCILRIYDCVNAEIYVCICLHSWICLYPGVCPHSCIYMSVFRGSFVHIHMSYLGVLLSTFIRLYLGVLLSTFMVLFFFVSVRLSAFMSLLVCIGKWLHLLSDCLFYRTDGMDASPVSSADDGELQAQVRVWHY